MLVLISGENFHVDSSDKLVSNLVSAISSTTRETDVLGWYERDVTLGLLMTEIGVVDPSTINTIIEKISTAVQKAVSPEKYRQLTLTYRVFPHEVSKPSGKDGDFVLYPDLSRRQASPTHGRILKRVIDVCGSLLAIFIFLPAFAIIALLVKLTSKGPILFCQKRVGRYGKEFNFYKFRTMYVDNDPNIHREYVAKLIAGDRDSAQGRGVYKLVNDPRVTPLGRLLRRTSLDELPQFVNVLRDDMSLVGPRPPLPYEYERYQTWHKRRVLELKPGLTGLWQVEGRSRTTFDEMVRMDLKYERIRCLWVDLRILIQTPAAMFFGRGAC